MPGWKTLSSEVVYESPWIRVKRDEVLNQKNQPLTYSYMELQNPTVFVVACNTHGEILLQKVFRYTLNKRIWEIPAGYMEKSEQPLVAAQRELTEECGLQSDDWHSLGRIYQITGTGNAPIEIFLARNVSGDGIPTDKDEDITDRHFINIQEIERMIADGELIDSPVIAAIYMAKNYGLQKEEK
jgi:8-oxo-dGTP pyrophosphatase MutT (NUDIX family)